MPERALHIYVNDHVAGSTMGHELAEHLRDANRGTPLGDRMARIAEEIGEDRQTLADLAERLGITTNPMKKGVAWLAEKAAELKFSGATSGDPELGTFVGLETLSLGVEGKVALWRSLAAIADDEPALEGMDFGVLIARGEAQRGTLEDDRMTLGTSVLRAGGA